MKIHSDFECGNIIVTKQVGDTVYLKHDMRDSQGEWFYWAFCAEECQKKTITFSFDSDIIGYYGPAVSYDLVSWHWLDNKDNDHSFTYTFKENKVSTDRLIASGRAFYKALMEYLKNV